MNKTGGTNADTPSPHPFKLLGGQLCLDFVNTVDWRGAGQPQDLLNTYGDLLSWGRQAGLVTGHEAVRLARRAEESPAPADDVLKRAVAFREALYSLFSSVSDHRPLKEADLAALNSELARALPRLRILPETHADGFTWGWCHDEDALDRVLWPVAESAAALLTSEDLYRVRRCAETACGWLFLDMSRNRSRRWCAMRDCGNRAKARRHYLRRRRATASAGPPAARADEPADALKPGRKEAHDK